MKKESVITIEQPSTTTYPTGANTFQVEFPTQNKITQRPRKATSVENGLLLAHGSTSAVNMKVSNPTQAQYNDDQLLIRPDSFPKRLVVFISWQLHSSCVAMPISLR